jgi:hypothetical protein
MPSSSGSGGVQSTQAQQIVKEMIEGDKQKKLDATQQSTQLREQARTQETLRDSGQAKRGQEEGRGEKAGGKEGEAASKTQGRAALREQDTRTKAERQMDGFLSRQSNQAQQRDAGRSFNLNRNQASMNAQAWSVLNSPQTPPNAKQAILTRQPHQGNAGQAAHHSSAMRSFQTAQQTRPGAGTQQWNAGQATAFRDPQIRYTQPRSPSEQRTGHMPQQNIASQLLARQLGKLALAQQGQDLQGAQNKPTEVVVHIRGNVVFIKDGPKTRAFKLDKEGNLEELPTEHAGEEPLSQEAKDELTRVLRQKGVHTGGEGLAEESGQISEEQLAQLQAEESVSKGEEALDMETQFALLLYEALEENKKFGRRLNPGDDPQFPGKKDWEAFFAKMLGLGNQEKASKKTLDEILSMLFRGIFNKKGKGQYFVGDLKYQKSGKDRTEKFAQVEVSNETLLKLLTQLKPGQSLDAETLKQFFGQEIAFLQMAHEEQKAFNMAEGVEKNVTFNPKANVNLYSQARLEDSLFGKRGQTDSSRGKKDALTDAYPGPTPQGVFANVYELMGLRKLYEGNPKRYAALAYLLMAGTASLALLFLFLKLF